MVTINVNREQMIMDINDHLTGMVESATCSGAERLQEGNYRFLRSYKKTNGDVLDMYVPHTCLIEGYHNHGTSKLPSHLVEKLFNDDLLVRVWSHLKGI